MTPYQISSEIYGGFYYLGITLKEKLCFTRVGKSRHFRDQQDLHAHVFGTLIELLDSKLDQLDSKLK